MKEKKGISLIVLIVTIIVMIIIAGAVILTLTDTNVIDQAETAVEKHNLSEIKSAASMAYADWILNENTTEEGNISQIQNYIRKTLIEQGMFTWQESSKYYITETGAVEEMTTDEFIFTVEIPEDDLEFEFAIVADNNIIVDWGDGTVQEVQYITPHTYQEPGIYDIKISGNITYFDTITEFNSEKIIAIKSWGNIGLEELYIYWAHNLKYIAASNKDSFTNLKSFTLVSNIEEIPDYLFKDCNNLEYVEFTDSEKLKYIPEHLFEGCDTASIDINFANCTSLENVPEEWQ